MSRPKVTAETVAAAQYDDEGNQRTQVEMATRLGVSVPTIRRAIASMNGAPEGPGRSKADREVQLVYNALVAHINTHVWPPSQRDIVAVTGLTLSRVNYLLQVMRSQGLIELGPNPREVRIVGSRMVMPEVTM